ncbi:MAG: pilus assembly protein [Candidatus Omnitrophica bacterium]|nr:pilus assembly protein [Candidatus Omnitrophota bacterium]
MANRILNLKGQATLETAIVFFLVVALFGGIIKIWLWENRQIVERQLRYNATRVSAGTGSDTYKLQWPIYTPPDLKEEDVIINNSSFRR